MVKETFSWFLLLCVGEKKGKRMTSPNLIFRAGEMPKGVMGPFVADCVGSCKSCLPSNASAALWASAWQESWLGDVWVSEKSWFPFGSRRIKSSKLPNLLF